MRSTLPHGIWGSGVAEPAAPGSSVNDLIVCFVQSPRCSMVSWVCWVKLLDGGLVDANAQKLPPSVRQLARSMSLLLQSFRWDVAPLGMSIPRKHRFNEVASTNTIFFEKAVNVVRFDKWKVTEKLEHFLTVILYCVGALWKDLHGRVIDKCDNEDSLDFFSRSSSPAISVVVVNTNTSSFSKEG